MTKQEQFFYDNAGFSYDPKAETAEQGKVRCAVDLARAETWAVTMGLTFVCEPDPDADESWMDDEPTEYQDRWRGEAWFTTLWDASGTHALGSLSESYGGADYKRVVRAELAFEAMKRSCTCGRGVGHHDQNCPSYVIHIAAPQGAVLDGETESTIEMERRTR